MVVEPITDRPDARFRPGSVLRTEAGEPLTVDRFEATGRAPLLTFREVAGRDRAETLRGAHLYIPAGERRGLDEEEYWPDELAGMEVQDRSGSILGSVAGVEQGVAQDRLLVDTGEEVIRVPFVAELVPEVDREARRVVVSLPPGLMD